MPRGPLPRTIVLAAFGVGLALQLIQAWTVGDQRWMPQHVVQFVAGAAVWWMAAWPGMRLPFRVVAVAFLVAMISAYVLNAFQALPWLSFAPGQRNGLWWRDPNLLGIALTSTAALAAMLTTKASWLAAVLWGTAFAVAVASRTRVARDPNR